jgi:23S rRNA (pseudouridine1915-N3)-methyltransferase
MPAWVENGYQDYIRRLPTGLNVELREIPLARRRKDETTDRAVRQEGKSMLKAVMPGDQVIALAVDGESWSSTQLARHLRTWQESGGDVSFLIGGPDGLDQSCLQSAHKKWSLSAMTLPHSLARIMLAEQLYRAWSINAGHPYHR